MFKKKISLALCLSVLAVTASLASNRDDDGFQRRPTRPVGQNINNNNNAIPAQLPADFDAQTYLNLNVDVANAANQAPLDQRLAFARNHYRNFGAQEGRQYTARRAGLPDGFYVHVYLELNPDLDVATRGMDYFQREAFATNHYLNNGRREGRQYTDYVAGLPYDFNPQTYLNRHPDLQRATLNMTEARRIFFARNHYVQNGRAEGRAYIDPQVERVQAERLERERIRQEEQARLERERLAQVERENHRREEEARLARERSQNQIAQELLALIEQKRNANRQLRRLANPDLNEEALPADSWRNFLPADPAARPHIPGGAVTTPLESCARFLANYSPDILTELTNIQQLVETKIADADAQQNRIVSHFWNKMRANLIEARQPNTDKFAVEFLNEITEVLSLPYLQAHFENTRWTTQDGNKFLAKIYLLLHQFSTLSAEQRAYCIMEWKYHILPSVRKTCEWIDEIHAQGLDILMNEIYEAGRHYGTIRADNMLVNIPNKINAFRLPVINVRDYMLNYLHMFIHYSQTPGQINPYCLLNMNINATVGTHRNIPIVVGNENSYLHPEHSIWAESPVFVPVHFIESNRNFTTNFLDCYRAFKNAGRLPHFFTNVLGKQADACCLNARSAILLDARIQNLPVLLGPLVPTVLRDGSINPKGCNMIVEEVLQALCDGIEVPGIDNVTVDDANLNNILMDFFHIGQANAVRGNNGQITIQILKGEIRRFVQKNTLELSGIDEAVYRWSQN